MSHTIEAKALLNNRSIQDCIKDFDAKPVHRLQKSRMQICELVGLISVIYRSVSFCTDDYEDQILDKGIADLGGESCLLTIVQNQLKNIETELHSLQTDLRELENNGKNEFVQTQSEPSPPPVSLVPDKLPDLTEILIDRLSDDLLNEIDLKAISGKVFNSMVNKAKNRFFAWLQSEETSFVPMNEIDAQIVDIDTQKVA